MDGTGIPLFVSHQQNVDDEADISWGINMNCPQCNKEMKSRVESYLSIAHWDSDYDVYFHNTHYSCQQCKIYCTVNDEGYSDTYKWDIPYQYWPTEKQIKTVKFINSILRTNEQCYTRKQARQFINKNINRAKRGSNNNFYSWCEDNQDWLLEYY